MAVNLLNLINKSCGRSLKILLNGQFTTNIYRKTVFNYIKKNKFVFKKVPSDLIKEEVSCGNSVGYILSATFPNTNTNDVF